MITSILTFLLLMWLFVWRPERKERRAQERKEREEAERIAKYRLENAERIKDNKRKFESMGAPDFITASDSDIEEYLTELNDAKITYAYFEVANFLGRDDLSELLEQHIIEAGKMRALKKKFMSNNAPDFITASETEIETYLSNGDSYSDIEDYFNVAKYYGRHFSKKFKREVSSKYFATPGIPRDVDNNKNER